VQFFNLISKIWFLFYVYNKPCTIIYGNNLLLSLSDTVRLKWQFHTKVYSVDLRESGSFGNLGIKGIMLLKCRWYEVWIWVSSLRTTPSAASCESGIKLWVRYKAGHYLTSSAMPSSQEGLWTKQLISSTEAIRQRVNWQTGRHIQG
jgi:hypothetical protein